MPDCYFHPGTETNVRCANCDKYICPKDMVETPVGIKCRECAAPPKAARRRGKPIQYVGAAAAALGVGIVGGLLLGQAFRAVPFLGFLRWWIWAAFGAGVGEAARRGAQGNRGPYFAAIAGVGAFIGASVGMTLGRGYVDFISIAFATGGAVIYVLSGRW